MKTSRYPTDFFFHSFLDAYYSQLLVTMTEGGKYMQVVAVWRLPKDIVPFPYFCHMNHQYSACQRIHVTFGDLKKQQQTNQTKNSLTHTGNNVINGFRELCNQCSKSKYLRSLYESIKDDLCSPQSVKYTADDVLVPKSFEEGLFK